jgi:hypothetical protein
MARATRGDTGDAPEDARIPATFPHMILALKHEDYYV